MDAWLTSPRKYANGTKMSFAGLGNPQERADLMVYMNNQGSNLPLPTPEAAPAADAATADPAASGAPADADTPPAADATAPAAAK